LLESLKLLPPTSDHRVFKGLTQIRVSVSESAVVRGYQPGALQSLRDPPNSRGSSQASVDSGDSGISDLLKEVSIDFILIPTIL